MVFVILIVIAGFQFKAKDERRKIKLGSLLIALYSSSSLTFRFLPALK